MNKTIRIAVIGGSGFIGGFLTRRLVEAGYEHVTVVSRHAPQKREPGIKYASGIDISDTDRLIQQLADTEIIFNLAGLVSFDPRDRERLREINEDAVCRLIAAARHLPALKRMIHLSSTAALGFGKQPIDETNGFDFSSCPLLTYSRSKAVANPVIDASPVPTNIVFPPMVLGPEDHKSTHRYVHYVKGKRMIIAPPGSNSFVDVRDLATALVLIMEKAPPHENYIVISGHATIAEVFAAAARVMHAHPRIFVLPHWLFRPSVWLARLFERFVPPLYAENIFLGFQNRVHEDAKIRSLGFEPQYSLEDSLRDYWSEASR